MIKGTPKGRQFKPRTNSEPFDVSRIEIPDWVFSEGVVFLEEILPKLSYNIDETDLPSVFMMANAFALVQRASKQLAQEGLVVEYSKGISKNPLIQVIRDQTQLYANLASRFGFTPADRARILSLGVKTNEEEVDDTFMSLISEMNN